MRRLGSSYNGLLTAYTISNVGNGVLLAALPLLVASSTRNPVAISGLMAAAGLPWLLIGPLTGAIVDRVDRRSAMVLAEASLAAVMAAAAVYVFGGGDSIVALYALLIVVGIGETFFDAAGLALVPRLVSPVLLDTANGRLFGAQTLAQRFVGPPLGGWLFAFAAWVPLGIDAVSFLVAGLVVLWLPRGAVPECVGPLRPRSAGRDHRRYPVGVEGLGVAGIGGGVRGSSLCNGSGLVGPCVGGPGPVRAHGFRIRTHSERVGHRFHPRLHRRPFRCLSLPPAKMCVAALIGAASGYLLVAGSGIALVGGLGLALVGASAAQLDVVSISYRQAGVPDRILGRVMAGFLFVGHGATPIGALTGGLVAAWAGVGYAYVASALAVTAVAPYLWVALKDTELDPGLLQGESPES